MKLVFMKIEKTHHFLCW